ncbi:hypothetical protein CJF32_00009343 [Rutstroemia sp. NJR-2017a WRK4]|nr:hypothetical protein CJF32_00009343 [Rutstroemia sp. NJR-2017a WRK4]
MASSQITLSEALPSDFETFPTISHLAFSPTQINQLMFPAGLDASDISRNASKYKDRATNGCSKFVKAVSADGEIVGFSEWLYCTEEKGMTKKPNDIPDWGPNANSELCDLFFGGLHKARIAAMEGKRCLVLQILAIHPSHQGKGIGTRLLQEGLRQADELGLPVWVEASEKGRPLYRKFGFNDFKTIEIDLAEWGGEGIDKHVCMLREVHIES